MDKKRCLELMNTRLRRALKARHAVSGTTQEILAELMQVSVRAISAMENGEQGFSVFTLVSFAAAISEPQRVSLLNDLCRIMTDELNSD